MPDKTGLWGALGTPKAVRIISVGMLIYLLIIGGLTYGYAEVSSCLARYADLSATSQAARADAAAQDRQLNDAEGLLSDGDRARYAADQKAMAEALGTLLDPTAARADRAAKLRELLDVNRETARVLAYNEQRREQIRNERARIERERLSNPVPPPPSETC